MLGGTGARMTASPTIAVLRIRRLARFIDTFVDLKASREWLPTLMLREMAEGAPHLDLDTLGMMRVIFGAFARILADGEAEGRFRPVNPILGYMSVIGPLLLNAARERAAAQPGRGKLPMFVTVSSADLVSHLQQVALRMLAKD